MLLTIEIPVELEQELLTEARKAGGDAADFAVAAVRQKLAARGPHRARAGTQPRRSSEPEFRTSAVSLGRCLIEDLDNVAEALACAEPESFR